jgi:hypothetical protein
MILALLTFPASRVILGLILLDLGRSALGVRPGPFRMRLGPFSMRPEAVTIRPGRASRTTPVARLRLAVVAG